MHLRYNRSRRVTPTTRLLCQADFQQVLQHYLRGRTLVKKGEGYSARSLTLCPFHSETTASFMVFPDGYCCLGCGARGNVIKFVMEYANLSFEEVVTKVSEITGVKVPRGPTDPARARRRDRNRRRRLVARRNLRAQQKHEEANEKKKATRARERSKRVLKADAGDDLPF